VLLERAAELEITTARTVGELEALAPEWHELWLRAPDATPFQSPAWLIPWAKHFTNGKLNCLAVRTGQADWSQGGHAVNRDTENFTPSANPLIGFVPAFVWANPSTGQRELLLLGTGVSDYCDGVFASECSAEAAEAALAYLHGSVEWHLLDFQELRSSSRFSIGTTEPQSILPILQLPTFIERLGETVPKSQLQNLAYYRRRAERLGECEWQTANRLTLDGMLDDLFALHSARWQQKGKTGVATDDNVRAFLREAARELLKIGALRVYRLTVKGETAAVLCAFASHGQTFYYLSGFDPRFADISPGTLTIGHAIERAVTDGCTRFDFLRGAERYKYLWGAKDTQTCRWIEKRTL
jgi:CelD/BcsL family acetyltransferase involved in cellulose biosynthesis